MAGLQANYIQDQGQNGLVGQHRQDEQDNPECGLQYVHDQEEPGRERSLGSLDDAYDVEYEADRDHDLEDA